jgi:hypothetical protein
MSKYEKFESYGAYIKYQKRRASRTKGLTQKRELRREYVYGRMEELGLKCKNILCLGARDDSEVSFFEKKGMESKGIDLYATDKIIKCDMSKMLKHAEIKDEEYDVFFASEALEHCLDFEGFIKGLNKVCKKYFICIGPTEKKVVEGSLWDCSIHEFMKKNNEEELKQCLEDTFEKFSVIVSELHKQNTRVFFIMEKK